MSAQSGIPFLLSDPDLTGDAHAVSSSTPSLSSRCPAGTGAGAAVAPTIVTAPPRRAAAWDEEIDDEEADDFDPVDQDDEDESDLEELDDEDDDYYEDDYDNGAYEDDEDALPLEEEEDDED
ncbi:MAG: hypothetical protein ACYTGG_00715 [Planctomycetota bacterium]|jgi:hypothetical protein